LSSTLTRTHTGTHTHTGTQTQEYRRTHTHRFARMDSVFFWEGGASRKNHVLSTRIAHWKVTKENSVLVLDFERTVPLFQFCPQAREQYSSVLSGGNIVPSVEICPRAARQTYGS